MIPDMISTGERVGWVAWRVRGFALLTVASSISLLANGGFPIPVLVSHHLDHVNLVLAAGFLALFLESVLASAASPPVVARRMVLALPAVVAAGLLVVHAAGLQASEAFHAGLGDAFFGFLRLFLLLCVLAGVLRSGEWFLSRGWRAELLLAGSFAVMILLGAVLLSLPNAVASGREPLTWIDALFTATSATSVTGLTVRETGTDFSDFGHAVILGLIQAGGLGIITFVALLSTLSRKTLPVSQMAAFRRIINAPALGDLRMRVAGIVGITLVLELAGAMALAWTVDTGLPPAGHWQWCVFHSVSAFCNAGFSLQPDSLASLAGNLPAMSVIGVLIVLGGLGFLVIPELLGRLWFARRGAAPVRLSVQTRLSLVTTALLLVGGTLLFLWLEGGGVLSGMGWAGAAGASFFQSVTARTAGFSTMEVGEFGNATLLMLAGLMVVGGCPVSTAGGVKTVTLAVVALGLRALVRGNSRIEAFGRTVPARVVASAFQVFLLAVVVAGCGMVLVAWLEPRLEFRDVFFECISALGTVGLGTGVTADLGTPAKLVVCVLMFLGRVGPIAMVLSVFQAARSMDYEFPAEEVVVG
jgi:trk system potassium uptake protein